MKNDKELPTKSSELLKELKRIAEQKKRNDVTILG
jgi:hypothetical protein